MLSRKIKSFKKKKTVAKATEKITQKVEFPSPEISHSGTKYVPVLLQNLYFNFIQCFLTMGKN